MIDSNGVKFYCQNSEEMVVLPESGERMPFGLDRGVWISVHPEGSREKDAAL